MWARIGGLIKNYLGSKVADKAAESNVLTTIMFFHRPTVLIIGGIVVTSFILLMLMPLVSMGSTSSLSIMQAVDPSGTDDTCDDTDISTSQSYDFEEYINAEKKGKKSESISVELANTQYKDMQGFNEYIKKQVDSSGYGTRNGVVAAGIALAGEYLKTTNHYFRYSSNYNKRTKSNVEGLNKDATYFDCSSYAWWTLYNGGFKLPTRSFTGAMKDWANKNGYLKEVGSQNGQAGDFLIHYKQGGYHHIRLIVGTYDGGYYTAEDTGGDANGHVKVHKYSYSNLKKGHYEVIDMTEYYNNTSNIRTNSERQSKVSTASASTTTNNSKCQRGPILLIAGHSYEPYCKQVDNECRGKTVSGYAEEEETRSLVKLIKSELTSMRVETDIANELLGGTDSKMNKSFFVESVLNTRTFNSINWSKYKYVLEVHFNASGSHTDSGPLLVKNAANYSTDADKGIVEAVTKNTGKKQGKDSIQQLNDLGYFTNLNIPITYLETEYYDNKNAMDVYSSKKSQIAKDIAQAIKDTYGKAENSGESSSSERDAIVARAKSQLGKPYVWGATGPDSYDCSGLVGYALTGKYERIGTTYTFMEWKETKNPKPGDVCVTSEHTGLYIGNGQMIHAPQQGDVVKIAPVQAGMKYVVYPGLKS